ncbi:MAG: hypothetical protein H0W02_11680 [Ktedonobacteraceae bacterium]|nr:hypothetical protein [Ktedonobacteraceae bacterium]
MQKQPDNPAFTRLFRLVTIAELFVVGLAGIGLFFLPGLAKTQWPWHITPFNMLFLGGAYLSSLAFVRPINWSSPGTWLWVGIFAVLFVLGLGLIYLARTTFMFGHKQQQEFKNGLTG